MDAVFREPGNEMKQDAHETGRSYRRQRIRSLTEPGIELYAALSEHQLRGYSLLGKVFSWRRAGK